MKKYLASTIIALSLLVPCFAQADITTGLQGWWKFDEGSGTISNDSSGNGHTGTNIGTSTYLTGKIGPYAINFNGTSQTVATTFQTSYNDFSACAWYNAQGTQGHTNVRIFDTNYQLGYWVGSNGANTWGGGVLKSSAPYGIFVTLSDGSWHHICEVRAGTLETIYGDGGAVKATSTVSASQIGTYQLGIGCESQNVSCVSYFKGYLDDARIYNRALSAADVSELYAYTGLTSGNVWMAFQVLKTSFFRVLKGSVLKIQ